MSSSRRLPTTVGVDVLERRRVGPHAGDVHARPCGRRRSCPRTAGSGRARGSAARRRSARPRSAAPGARRPTTSWPILSCRLAMIETRFALPRALADAVHRPLDLARRRRRRPRASSRRRTRRRCGRGSRPGRGRRARRTTAAVASATWCGQRRAVRVAQARRCSAPAARRGLEALERVRAVVAEAVEEVLGVVDDALARGDEERDRLLDHREVLGAVDADDLLEVQRPRLADDRAHRARSSRPGSAGRRPPSAATPRRRVMPNAAICACSKRSPREQLEELELLGVRATGSRPRSGARRARRGACATRSFSCADSVMPSPCIPSRRVAS